MQCYKRHLLTAAGVLAAVGITALFTARRIEAQYASPVKVMNVSPAPALTSSMDEPGRTPYFSRNAPNCSAVTYCVTLFAPVPTGQRLVVTNVSGFIYLATPGVVYGFGLGYYLSG